MNTVILIGILMTVITCKTLLQNDKYIQLELKRIGILDMYFTTIYIGTPPQQQLFLVDTGSSIANVKASNCQNCKKVTKDFFYPDKSKTYQNITCVIYKNIQNILIFECLIYCPDYQSKQLKCFYQIKYGRKESSTKISGILGIDQFFFDQISTTKITSVIGCNNYQSQSSSIFNGILGIGYQPQSLMTDWFKTVKLPIDQRKLGLCFQGERGYMQWGLIPKADVNSTLISLINSYNTYRINIEEMSIKEQNILNISALNFHRGALMDSGSSAIIIPQNQYNKVFQIIDNKCTSLLSTCSKYDSKDYPFASQNSYPFIYYFTLPGGFMDIYQYLNFIFPEIKIKINGTFLNLKPSKYFLKSQSSGNGYYCVLNILPSKQNQYILGISWMSDKKIIFNLDKVIPYVEIYQGYQCFNYGQQIIAKLSSSIFGYLIICSLFFVLLIRQKIYLIFKVKKVVEVNDHVQL